jgi:hypothetical protein
MAVLLTASSVLMCPHGGLVKVTPVSQRVRLPGGAVLRADDGFEVMLCPFPPTGTPHPCKTVQWRVTATKVAHAGSKVLTADSVGVCLAADNSPQGLVMIQPMQAAVTGV